MSEHDPVDPTKLSIQVDFLQIGVPGQAPSSPDAWIPGVADLIAPNALDIEVSFLAPGQTGNLY
jgi:hypothetical protein